MADAMGLPGGPAFPISIPGYGDNGCEGMSLRDYFAAQIAAGMAAYSGTSGVSYGPEQAERALAEAVKVVESLLLSLSNNSSERVKAARQFVKEHSANADQ